MKKTLHIDEQLLREAKSAAGAKTDTDTVRLGLEALIRVPPTSVFARSAGRSHVLATSADGVSGLPRPGIPRHERLGRHLGLDSLPVEPSTVRR
jgi:hypothetical protein